MIDHLRKRPLLLSTVSLMVGLVIGAALGFGAPAVFSSGSSPAPLSSVVPKKIPPGDAEALAKRFVPFLVLAEAENYEPMPADLVFEDCGAQLGVRVPRLIALTAARIVKECLSPRDLTKIGNPYFIDYKGLQVGDGLDYAASFGLIKQRPNFEHVAYAEVMAFENYVNIDYWFFYYYNDAYPPFSSANTFFHEGDWERVRITVDQPVAVALNAQPSNVFYSRHTCDQPGTMPSLSWVTLPDESRDGVRPVIYVGRGSHAAYASPGLHSGDGPCANHDYAWDGVSETKRIDPKPYVINCYDRDTAQDRLAWLRFRGKWGGDKSDFGLDSNSPVGPCDHAR